MTRTRENDAPFVLLCSLVTTDEEGGGWGDGRWGEEAGAGAWRTSGHRKGRTDSGRGIGISLFFFSKL